MKQSGMKVHRLLAPLAALLVLACGESTAPDSAKTDAVIGPRGSVVPVPDPGDVLVGRIILCKATESVSPPAATFTFNVTLDTDPVSNPTVDVGACIDIVNDAPAAHSATISEQALTDWNLDSIVVEVRDICAGLVSENGTTATAVSNEDCWTRVTFWNSFDEPDVPEGCTLTQGYWKTHSDLGPAPFDDTWDLLLPSGSSTVFYLSTQTWYAVFHTPTAGNAYYILAQQYMAAVLNGLAGADLSAVNSEMTTADGLFGAWTPAQIGVLKGNNALRQQFISLAGTLAGYNEGDIGPGHCEDD